MDSAIPQFLSMSPFFVGWFWAIILSQAAGRAAGQEVIPPEANGHEGQLLLLQA